MKISAAEAVLDLVQRLDATAKALQNFSRDMLTLVYPAAVAVDAELDTLISLGTMEAYCNQLRLEVNKLGLDETALSAVTANYKSLTAGGPELVTYATHVVRNLRKGNQRAHKFALALCGMVNSLPRQQPPTFVPPTPVAPPPPVMEVLPPAADSSDGAGAGMPEITETTAPIVAAALAKPKRQAKVPEPPPVMPQVEGQADDDTLLARYSVVIWPGWKMRYKMAATLLNMLETVGEDYNIALLTFLRSEVATKADAAKAMMPADIQGRIDYVQKMLTDYRVELKAVAADLVKLVDKVKSTQ